MIRRRGHAVFLRAREHRCAGVKIASSARFKTGLFACNPPNSVQQAYRLIERTTSASPEKQARLRSHEHGIDNTLSPRSSP